MKKKEGIKIDKMRDLIIIEKSNGNTVLKGSKFYCGCCGNILGEAKKEISFPCSVLDFNEKLKNKTFVSHKYGLLHKTCKNVLFYLKTGYKFIGMETYLEKVRQQNLP